MSFIPVREALRSLENEGLVQTRPGRSAVVAPVHLEDLHGIYRLRHRLEPEIASRSCLMLTSDVLEALEQEAVAFGREDLGVDEVYEGHQAFHLALLAPAATEWDLRILTTLWQAAERYIRIALLDTYESERHPVSTHGADWALLAFMNHFVIDAGVGLIPGAPPEANTGAFANLLADNPMGESLRARAAHCLKTQQMEFQAHDVEIGFTYPTGALVPDGSGAGPRDPMGRIYTPTTQPGRRLPHAWLEKDGRRLSTLDLLGTQGGYVLIAGSASAGWQEAAAIVQDKYGIGITVVTIGTDAGYRDVDGTWSTIREIDDLGAVLVRPDQFIAWRAATGPADATTALSEAVSRILAI